MSDFTAHWHWPQWAILGWWLIHLLIQSGKHGQPMIRERGPEKGEPERWNAFMALLRVAFWAFALIAGGFFS